MLIELMVNYRMIATREDASYGVIVIVKMEPGEEVVDEYDDDQKRRPRHLLKTKN